MEYRKVFYENYFNTQAGRRLNIHDLKKILEDESKVFSKEILIHFPENKEIKILDIGCGYGALLHSCSANGYKNVSGIDISPDMVKTAETLGIKGVSQNDIKPFLQKNINTFDVITGIDIIEHFSKDELVSLLNDIYTSLKPNGVAVFRTPNTDAPFFTIYSYGDFTHENYMNTSSAMQVMANIGFPFCRVFPSYIKSKNIFKEIFRSITWQFFKLRFKLLLFATNRSSKGVIFTPNMIIVGKKN